ncbi:hypothetical protein HMPREF1248_0567 [Coriobacteriaceae bacterium BV3Ac1]|nr:hypothetical protein HMPREF1248_0567 [Coriobacteriaceae bacterium BV3Ac1]
MHGNGVVARVRSPPEGFLVNLRPREHPAAMLREALAQGVLGGREGHHLAAYKELTRVEVDAHIAQDERMRAHPALSAQMGGHLGPQLRDAERLAHVVVGTQRQAAHGVLLGNLRGEEEDGRVHAVPDALHQLEAAHAGHHHVAQDEVVAGQVEVERGH